jgi:hypothetical protein
MPRLFPNRLYKFGARFALFRWTDVPTKYITRLHLCMAPIGAICIHWLNGPDPEPFLHDHPVSFLSILLRGRYVEVREVGPNIRILKGRRHFNFVRATDAHTIKWVAPGTVTICFMGPKVREWGFHTDKGWVNWQKYNEKYKGAESANLQDN